MKTTQEILREKGVEPRQIIFHVIQEIINDSKWKLSIEDTQKKIIRWHRELRGFDNDRILSGLKSVNKSEYDSIPTIGVFKKGCRRKEFKPTPPQKQHPWGLRLSNIAKIKQNLMDQNG